MSRLSRTNSTVRARDNKYIPQLNVYGNVEAAMRPWRGALQRCRSGTGDARMLFLGNSIAAGQGASTPLTQIFGQQAAVVVGARTGLTVRKQTFDKQYGLTPSEVTVGSGWGGTVQTLLPMAGWLGSSTAGTLDFLPTFNVDSFIIYSYKGGSAGNYTWAIDGGGATTHTVGGGAAGLEANTVSAGTLGSHTLHINSPAGQNSYILAVEGVSSTGTVVKWWCNGNSGFTTNSYASSLGVATSDTISAISALAPDFVGIELGVNDYSLAGGQLAPAVAQANLTKFVQNIQALTHTPSVVLVGWPPNGTATTSIANYTYPQAQYYQALDAVADTTGCLALHLDTRWGAYPASQVAPISFYSDVTHPGPSGHADMGAALANLALAGG